MEQVHEISENQKSFTKDNARTIVPEGIEDSLRSPFRIALLAVRRTLAGAQTKAFLGVSAGPR